MMSWRDLLVLDSSWKPLCSLIASSFHRPEPDVYLLEVYFDSGIYLLRPRLLFREALVGKVGPPGMTDLLIS